MAALAGAGGLGLGSLAFPMTEAARGGEVDRVPFGAIHFEIDPNYIAGVSPRTRVVSNAQGFRGNLLRGRAEDLLMLGGSTMQCLLLDERDTVGWHLERALREKGLQRAAVANAGFAGHTAQKLIPEFDWVLAEQSRWPGTVLAMFGANEVEFVLNQAPWVLDFEGQPTAGFDVSGAYGPSKRRETFKNWYLPGNRGAFIVKPRRAYQAEPKVSAVPAEWRAFLTESSQALAAALEGVAQRCEARGIRLVLATQPVNYDPRGNATGEGWAPFFFAQPGHGFLPAPSLMAALMEGFNQITRSVAQRRGLPLVELAQALSPQRACFYDQWHFTMRGAQSAADLLSLQLAPVMAGA